MSPREAFERTLIDIVTTRELLSLAVLSLLLYAFYYPAPYARQDARDMPLVVVDEAGSALARAVVRDLDATRSVRIVGTATGMAEARGVLLDRRAEGILLLSRDLDKVVDNPAATRPGAGAALVVNAAYLVRAEAIATALSEVLIDQAHRRVRTIDRRLPDPSRLVRVQPLFNTIAGYRDYVFPAVSNIILQQTLVFAGARLAAERRRRGAVLPGLGGVLGTWAALVVVGILSQMFFFGFALWLQDVPRGGNPVGLLLAMPPFAGAVAGLGLAIGHWVGDGDDALKLLMPVSIPLVFLTGFAWPLAQMPGWLATIAWASPATAAMHLFVRFNQMGASIAEASGPLAMMVVLCAAYTLLAALVMTRLPARKAGA